MDEQEVLFHRLFEQHRKLAWGRIRRILGAHDVIETHEALQDLRVRLLLRFNPEDEKTFVNLLVRSARNAAIDRLRKLRVRERTYAEAPGFEQWVPSPDPSPEETLLAAERRAVAARVIEAALLDMNPDQRTVFLMRTVEEMAFTEIAARVGVPEDTAKSRMRYAPAKLRKTALALETDAAGRAA